MYEGKWRVLWRMAPLPCPLMFMVGRCAAQACFFWRFFCRCSRTGRRCALVSSHLPLRRCGQPLPLLSLLYSPTPPSRQYLHPTLLLGAVSPCSRCFALFGFTATKRRPSPLHARTKQKVEEKSTRARTQREKEREEQWRYDRRQQQLKQSSIHVPPLDTIPLPAWVCVRMRVVVVVVSLPGIPCSSFVPSLCLGTLFFLSCVCV